MKKSTKIKRLKFSVIILAILIILIGILSAVLSTNGSGIVDNLKNLTADVASSIINDNTLNLSDDVKNRSDYKLSFSKFTFPHQMFRVMLMEQIYRAYKIKNNENYHK